MYTTGYPTYLGYPTYAPMQYYPSLGAYSYAMQPSAQLRPTIMIPVCLFSEAFVAPSPDKLFLLPPKIESPPVSERVRCWRPFRWSCATGNPTAAPGRATIGRPVGRYGRSPGRAWPEEKHFFGGRHGGRLHILVVD